MIRILVDLNHLIMIKDDKIKIQKLNKIVYFSCYQLFDTTEFLTLNFVDHLYKFKKKDKLLSENYHFINTKYTFYSHHKRSKPCSN